MTAPFATVAGRLDRLARRGYYALRALNYAHGVATPKRTVAGTYWSYDPVATHGRDAGLAALAKLPRDAVVVDVGAHVGEYAIPLARGGRTVHAVEPNPVAVARLRQNCRRNGADLPVHVHPVGLGDRETETTFYRSTYPKLSAFDGAATTRWGANVAGTDEVQVRTLDGLVADGGDPPDAVKVDVEGAELAVLRGGEATIARHHPLLVVEHHDDSTGDAAALRDWLRERAYRIEDHGPTWVCWHPDSPVRPAT